jgi:hypothetical protein
VDGLGTATTIKSKPPVPCLWWANQHTLALLHSMCATILHHFRVCTYLPLFALSLSLVSRSSLFLRVAIHQSSCQKGANKLRREPNPDFFRSFSFVIRTRDISRVEGALFSLSFRFFSLYLCAFLSAFRERQFHPT